MSIIYVEVITLFCLDFKEEPFRFCSIGEENDTSTSTINDGHLHLKNEIMKRVCSWVTVSEII